jgi:hypothetical protein
MRIIPPSNCPENSCGVIARRCSFAVLYRKYCQQFQNLYCWEGNHEKNRLWNFPKAEKTQSARMGGIRALYVRIKEALTPATLLRSPQNTIHPDNENGTTKHLS